MRTLFFFIFLKDLSSVTDDHAKVEWQCFLVSEPLGYMHEDLP